MQDHTSDLMTLKEVCEYLRISMVSCHAWVRDGKLPAIRVGREWRVKRAELDGWMDHQRNAGAA